jgi:hypothetical protein
MVGLDFALELCFGVQTKLPTCRTFHRAVLLPPAARLAGRSTIQNALIPPRCVIKSCFVSPACEPDGSSTGPLHLNGGEVNLSSVTNSCRQLQLMDASSNGPKHMEYIRVLLIACIRKDDAMALLCADVPPQYICLAHAPVAEPRHP